MKKYKILVLISFLLSSNVFSGETPNISKRDHEEYYAAPAKGRTPERLNRSMGHAERKLSVLDKGNRV
jgi:hypothetical protein